MKIWKSKILLTTLNDRSKGSLSDHLGIVYTEIGDDFLIAEMPVATTTLQPFGILHGGANCVLAESVASAAANFCIDNQKQVCVGLDINVNHIKAVSAGTITAKAIPYHLGRTTQVWEIKMFDSKKQLSAVSRLTLAVLNRKNLSK